MHLKNSPDAKSVELNSLSLAEFFENYSARFSFEILNYLDIEVVDELRAFGISNVSELKELFNDQFIGASNEHERTTTKIGLLRSAMLYSDVEKYFAASWKNRWQTMSGVTYRFLSSRYDSSFIDGILRENQITLSPHDH